MAHSPNVRGDRSSKVKRLTQRVGGLRQLGQATEGVFWRIPLCGETYLSGGRRESLLSKAPAVGFPSRWPIVAEVLLAISGAPTCKSGQPPLRRRTGTPTLAFVWPAVSPATEPSEFGARGRRRRVRRCEPDREAAEVLDLNDDDLMKRPSLKLPTRRAQSRWQRLGGHQPCDRTARLHCMVDRRDRPMVVARFDGPRVLASRGPTRGNPRGLLSGLRDTWLCTNHQDDT